MTYWIVIEENESGFTAFCPELTDCQSEGDCMDGAERDVLDVIENHFDALCTDGTLPADLTFQDMRVSITIF
jgi:predicted RNase H-like HicB family nuclease